MNKLILSKEWLSERKKGKLVFPEQKKIGKEIVKAFSEKILVTLCAPPQWGKTGVSLFVSYKMSLYKTDKVFYLTGMSDKSWVEQTKKRVLPSWEDNVYHRNTLHKLLLKLLDMKLEKKDKNILLIIDECHIANKTDNILNEIMEHLHIKNIEKLMKKNIKILQISATPSNALVDAEKWEKYHQKIIPVITNQYVSFDSFIKKEKLKTPYELLDFTQCEMFIEHFNNFPNNRYHFVRVSSKGPSGNIKYNRVKSQLKLLCEKKDYSLIEMNGTIHKSEINNIFHSLSYEPEKHTIILIKDMLGAAKTIDDSYIGCVHESTPDKKDYSSEVQGLPGRLCGWTKQKGTHSPILFCNRDIIETYLNLYNSKFSYDNDENIEWTDNKIRINMKGEIVSKRSYLNLDDY